MAGVAAAVVDTSECRGDKVEVDVTGVWMGVVWVGVVWVEEICVCVANGSIDKAEGGTEVCRSEAVDMGGMDSDVFSNEMATCGGLRVFKINPPSPLTPPRDPSIPTPPIATSVPALTLALAPALALALVWSSPLPPPSISNVDNNSSRRSDNRWIDSSMGSLCSDDNSVQSTALFRYSLMDKWGWG